MKIQRHRPDNSDRSSRDQNQPSRFNLAAVALGVSLLLLLGSGWLKSGGLKLAISGIAAVLLAGALVKIFRDLNFSSPRLLNGSPRQLAWIRILVCLTAFVFTVIEDLPSFSSLPAAMQNRHQLFHLLTILPGPSTLLSTPYLLGALQWTTATLLFLGLIGFQTRTTLFLGGLGFFLIQAILRNYSYLFHAGLVPLYLLLVISWTPCAATWSVDRWLNRRKPQPSARLIGFSVYACYAVMAVIYFVSGLSKLRESGLDWFRGENIEQKLVLDALEPIFLDYKWKASLWLVQHHAPDYIFAIIGAIGLIVELGYISVLFSRTARIIMPAAAFGVHLGILLFQHILFLDLLVLQFIFLEVDRILIFLQRHFWPECRIRDVAVSDVQSGPALSYLSRSALASIIAVFLVAWVWHIEFYPLSSWRMYANPERKGPAFYLKMVATLENGRFIKIPIHDCSPAKMPNVRFFLINAFRVSGRSKIIDQFLASYVQRRNQTLAFGSPISSLEIQRWRWNYVAEPNDPRFGWITDVYPFDSTAHSSPSR